MSYVLTDITSACSFDFFAPYNAVGNRLQQFVNIDPATGLVTPTALGINLVQIRWVNGARHHYIIARVQVHDTILGWWFGIPSITTAKDVSIAHAQPSIYALFSEDASGTDRVGDITGHGYVTLTSSDPAKFSINFNGRLQGLQEGDATLNGTFLTVNHSIPVKIVDYAKTRQTLDFVQNPDAEHPDKMHNILFIPEGFRDTNDDREEFNKIVTQTVDEMFNKPRHSPYPLLEGSFNIWKAYEPSLQHGATCAFRVNDEAVPNILGQGYAIPEAPHISSIDNAYTIELLVKLVGLPLRNETRNTAQLKLLWGSQSLSRFDSVSHTWKNNFDSNRVDDNLVAAWKAQKSLGILEARDTFFGLHLGARHGDRSSGLSIDPVTGTPAPVLRPVTDSPADANLAPFVKRMYEWFDLVAARILSPDPRRHPPELHAGNRTNDGNSILKYINGLSGKFLPHPNAGPEWIPDPTGATFKKSRGLIALITNDDMNGGANFNGLTITANTLAENTSLEFQYLTAGNERIMRRTISNSISENMDAIINTVAHEFGHSFNLGDEYESFAGDDPNSASNLNLDLPYDNLARLAAINLDANFINDRKIDPDKIKWFDLLRIQVSDTLVRDAEEDGGLMKVTIKRTSASRWTLAKNQNLEAHLRKPEITPGGRQLPLRHGDDHYLVSLTIESVDESNGVILLGGPELPPTPFPNFPTGSLLFIPKRDAAGKLKFVVEGKVLDKLKATNLPLNSDTDITRVNKDADAPVDIADFKAPCKSYKLVGVFEGANYFSGMGYRPTGLCKMRKSSDAGTGDGEFCHVCKWLIVNRVDPSLHSILDHNHYPEPKKNG